MQRVEADAIDKFGRRSDVPDRQISPLSASSVPVSCASPRAAAALRVTPSRHSSTVMKNSVAAMFMVSSNEVSGDVPGLQSVASAIATPLARKRATGGLRVSRMK